MKIHVIKILLQSLVILVLIILIGLNFSGEWFQNYHLLSSSFFGNNNDDGNENKKRPETPLSLLIKENQTKTSKQDRDSSSSSFCGCKWIFKKYHPSPFELKWREKILPIQHLHGDPLCKLMRKQFKN